MTSYSEPTGDSATSFDWRDRYPWLILLGVFRLSISPTVLLWAAVGAVVGSLGWRLAEATWLRADVVAQSAGLTTDVAYLGALPGERTAGSCPLGSDLWPAAQPLVARTGAGRICHPWRCPTACCVPRISCFSVTKRGMS